MRDMVFFTECNLKIPGIMTASIALTEKWWSM